MYNNNNNIYIIIIIIIGISTIKGTEPACIL